MSKTENIDLQNDAYIFLTTLDYSMTSSGQDYFDDLTLN